MIDTLDKTAYYSFYSWFYLLGFRTRFEYATRPALYSELSNNEDGALAKIGNS